VIANQPAAGCVNGSGLLNMLATSLTGAPQVIAQTVIPVLNDTATICHKAAISTVQTPGNYTEVVTLSTTANF
jgi:hypothetical protein